MNATNTAEGRRLAEDAARRKNWKRWGPYLSERQWGTVREDYSPDGDCWNSFPHDHARSRAYRWGEDGLLGITDRECRLCFALALWNGRDPILKERLFGLTNGEGNHGEDVKEEYFYLDSTPTHSYMKALYRYPQAEFPYEQLVAENGRHGLSEPEFELADTGVLDENKFFDVTAEYAKVDADDVLIRITALNRGPETATLHLLPTLWFRNTWIWGCKHEGCTMKPRIWLEAPDLIAASHESLGDFSLRIAEAPQILFTENETNTQRLSGTPAYTPFVKDAFHEFVIRGKTDAVNPKNRGTKAAAHCVFDLQPGESRCVKLRLSANRDAKISDAEFDGVFAARIHEADEFYDAVLPTDRSTEAREVSRQAYAGLLWNKQFYHYIIEDWLNGDPEMPKPAESRRDGRNAEWTHFYSRDVISVPDKWEYPWFAAWDLAFHALPLARIDPQFAKEQLLLLLREWYMKPNGHLPAYEFVFDDVNPPVHAWAVWRVYKISAKRGERDRDFLERAFQKLLLNFTWWVNRKDSSGHNLFSGGFLGLDNVGVFDRSKPLPTGGELQQADGTAWMAFYCLTMLAMAMELAHDGTKLLPAYEDMASKFFEHFVQISDAMNALGGCGLWSADDGFYYDQIRINDNETIKLKLRSMVGLLPLIAVEVIDQCAIDRLPGFKKRFEWFLKYRHDLARHIAWTSAECCPGQHRWLLAVPSRERLTGVLRYMLDEKEFLAPFGIRSLSKIYDDNPYVFRANGDEFRVRYVPGESDSRMFGGNSNWRGPVWFPVNYLLIEALQRFHHYFGSTLKIECPTGSGRMLELDAVANEISARLQNLFLPGTDGHRACHGCDHVREHALFHEYFDAETGRGLGASHQTGWTALIARCIEDYDIHDHAHAAK